MISFTENDDGLNKQYKNRVMQVGVDEIGKFKDIEESGIIKRVYFIRADKAREILDDRYNILHNYRRNKDTIVFYYNKDTNEKIVLAVKPGDDLSKHPFNLKEKFIVTEEIIRSDKVTPTKGIVSITKKNLEDLIKNDVLTYETAYVLYYNRQNVGFYL